MFIRHAISSVALVAGAFAVSTVRADQVSERIDSLVEEAYKKHKVQPNAPVNDETFVRRIYLDVIGRIPTQEEVKEFLASTESGKRSRLIDKLLDSEGHVSHSFNWWADVLRIQSNMDGEAGAAYAHWLKDSLRSNKPYDQFVRDLVDSRGYIWENGAVGYYLRDAGMPLDNMSNTTQIFLGTRLVCAQCHNHPFDKWTQKDYYQQAAYTFGVDTEAIASRGLADDIAKVNTSLDKSRSRSMERDRAAIKRLVDGMLEPLKKGVADTGKKLNLPNDYKYDDAKPGETIAARTIFGDKVNGKSDPREHYAAWMTSSDNPRFTQIIANRLWKRAMGLGLVEPVDDFREGTEASNPALLKYLTQQMSAGRYDIKKFLRSLYNTKTYQREVTRTDVPEDKAYYFPGPVLRRMTAEQMWDSVVAMVIPNPDLRLRGTGFRAQLENMRKEAELMEKATPQEIVAVAKKYAEQDGELDVKTRAAREKLAAARQKNDAAAVAAAQKELNAANDTRDGLEVAARNELLQQMAGKKGQFVSTLSGPGMKKKEEPKDPVAAAGISASQWESYGDEFFRASELPSPAPGGHFLREFGQSNREVIENASSEATVSQALNLMNGPLFEQITAEKTILMDRFTGASHDEGRMDALFMTFYARRPTDVEKAIVLETVKEEGPKKGWNSVIWALLNSREFVFVQ